MINNSKLNIRLSLHSTVPIIIGALIYLLFRTKSLFVFSWFKTVGLYEFIVFMREFTIPFRIYIPNWILFSLPDALWVYSITYLMLEIWHSEKTNVKYFWIFIGSFFGVGGEILQIYKIIPGTFDIIDLLLMIFFVIFAFSTFFYSITTKKYQESHHG